jgi:hypothetical protein
MISSASGIFKMRGPVWSDGDKEMYEGSFTFDVKYSSIASRKGFGRGDYTRAPFWAIRAAKDKDGEEIGVEDWSTPPAITSHSGSISDDDQDSDSGSDSQEDDDFGGCGGYGGYY